MIKKLFLSILFCAVSFNVFATSSPTVCASDDCVFLDHFNGSDGATTTSDSSATKNTITFVNNAQIDTAQFASLTNNTSSALFDGTNDYATAPDSNVFNLGSGDWTVGFRVRFNSVGTTQRFISQWESGSFSWNIGWLNSNNLAFVYSTDGTTASSAATFSWTPSTATWYHIEFDRSGNSLYVFVNGTQVGSTLDLTGVTFFDSTAAVLIGVNTTGLLNDFNGWLDELYVLKGTALHSSNFTSTSSEMFSRRRIIKT